MERALICRSLPAERRTPHSEAQGAVIMETIPSVEPRDSLVSA